MAVMEHFKNEWPSISNEFSVVHGFQLRRYIIQWTKTNAEK